MLKCLFQAILNENPSLICIIELPYIFYPFINLLVKLNLQFTASRNCVYFSDKTLYSPIKTPNASGLKVAITCNALSFLKISCKP